MPQTNATHHLESLIRSAFEDGRCGEYYLVDLETSSSGQITAYVDGDEGVSLDACTQISRVLESILDAEPTLGGIYTLEVSSPGVSRPLKFPRQYLKHTGRTLKVKLVTGDTLEGELKTTSHDTITLEIASKEKKGKPELREVAYADIDEAYVTVSFAKPKN